MVFFGGVVMYIKKFRVGGVRIFLVEGSNYVVVSYVYGKFIKIWDWLFEFVIIKKLVLIFL